MREIIPAKLWIGNLADCRNWEQLLGAGIGAVIDLAIEEAPARLPRSIGYCRFPIVDGEQDRPDMLRMAIDTVASMLRRDIAVVVCCGAGMSRSPAVAAAAMSLVLGGSAEERLREVVRDHPHDVSPLLWEEIHKVLAERG